MQYIRVKDVEKIIDRDRNTILRWEREGLIPHPQKDSRGWRFYTEKDIQIIKKFMDQARRNLEGISKKETI
jgi:DNA-binding transcriptional MerR regulator